MGAITEPERGNGEHERIASYRDPELRVLFAVTLMAVLGVASIGPALPRLRAELGVPIERIGLVVTMFTLPGVILTPLLGIAADRMGRKRVLLPSLVLFGIAGTACSLAQNLVPLLGLRLLQGVGAAALASINLTLIGDLFQGRQRTTAMGYNASVLSIGTATYPLLGGGLAMIGWHWPFALPVMALPVAVLVATRLHEPPVVRAQGLGTYLSGVWRETRRPRVLVLYASSCGIFILLYGAYITFLPLFMADSFGSSPLAIGAVMTSLSVVNGIVSSQLGRLSARIPERTLLQIGFLAFALGLAVIPLAPVAAALAVPAVLLGFAFATTIPVVMSLLAALAPDEQRAAFMSLNGTVLRLGQTLGPLIMTAVYAAGGFGAVYAAGAMLAVALAALTAAVVKEA
jgi:ACDE family multidrug resistance protein